MHSSFLKLVHSAAVNDAVIQAARPPLTQRKLFWSSFLDWLATATDDESEQLERALAPHAHHVRPLVEAVSEALYESDAATRLPATLLAQFCAAGWRPMADTKTAADRARLA